MSKTLVVTCDWCLDPIPVLKPVEVVVEGVSLDLCPDHAAKWEGITKSGGGFRPRAGGSEGSTDLESGVLEPVSGSSSRSVEFHASKKASSRTSTPGTGATARAKTGKASKATKVSKVAKKGTTSRSSGSQKLRSSVDSSAVRAWAQSNGIAVPARGPLKASLIEQFLDSPLNKKSKVPSASFTSAS